MKRQDDSIPAGQMNSSTASQDNVAPTFDSSRLLKRLRAKGVVPSNIPSSQSPSELVEALESSDPEKRMGAIRALGRLKENTYLNSLVRLMQQDDDENIRAAAAKALGEQKENAPLNHLLPALRDPSWRVRVAVIQTITKSGRRVPASFIIKLLQDEHESVRAAAAGALGSSGDKLAIQPLLNALHDENWHVREVAVLSLGNFGKEVPAEEMVPVLYDRDPQVRATFELLADTQPELFHAVLAAKRDLQRQEEQAQRHFSSGISFSPLVKTALNAQPYPRRGRIKTLRHYLLYGWCMLLGYLGGCLWYLFNLTSEDQPFTLTTLLSIVTLTDNRLHTMMPAWGYLILSLSLFLLMICSSWATLDLWREHRTLNQKNRRSNSNAVGKKSTINPLDEVDSLSPYYPYATKPERRARTSRRAVLAGIATSIIVSNGLAWSWLLKRNQQGDLFGPPVTLKRTVRTYKIPGGALALAWSPNSKRIVTGGPNAQVQIRTAQTGQVIQVYQQAQTIQAIGWSPNGKYIASGSSDSTIHIWDATNGQTIIIFHGHQAGIVDLAWSPDNTQILSSSSDGVIHRWDVKTGEIYQSYEGYKTDCVSVAWSRDGSRIALCGLLDQLMVLRIDINLIIFQRSLEKQNKTPNASSPIYGVNWSPDSTMLAISDRQGNIQIFRAEDGKELQYYKPNSAEDEDQANVDPIIHIGGHIAWSPDGKELAITTPDRKMQVLDAKTGHPRYVFQNQAGYFFDISWSPDGLYLAATRWNDPALLIWQASET